MAALRLQLSDQMTDIVGKSDAVEKDKNPPRRKKQTRKKPTMKTTDQSTDTPEASKLRDVDKELSAVVKAKSEPVENRVKEYEELLASYKEVVERLKKQDGASTAVARSVEDDAEEDDDESSGRFEDVLKRVGVRFENDRVYIPLKKDDKVRRKCSAVSYSCETFDKVVNFVKLGSKVYVNHFIRHVTLKLFELLKEVVNVSRYPGFADVAQVNSASFNGVWSRL